MLLERVSHELEPAERGNLPPERLVESAKGFEGRETEGEQIPHKYRENESGEGEDE